jgi:hypothetical protein
LPFALDSAVLRALRAFWVRFDDAGAVGEAEAAGPVGVVAVEVAVVVGVGAAAELVAGADAGVGVGDGVAFEQAVNAPTSAREASVANSI